MSARTLLIGAVLCCWPFTVCAQESTESESAHEAAADDTEERVVESAESESELDASAVEGEELHVRPTVWLGHRSRACPRADPRMDWTVPGVLFGVGAALLAGSVVVGLTWWRDLDAQVLGCAAADCPMRGMLENERNAAIATTAGLAALGLAFHIAAAFSLMFAPLQPSSSRCGPAAAGFACSGRF